MNWTDDVRLMEFFRLALSVAMGYEFKSFLCPLSSKWLPF